MKIFWIAEVDLSSLQMRKFLASDAHYLQLNHIEVGIVTSCFAFIIKNKAVKLKHTNMTLGNIHLAADLEPSLRGLREIKINFKITD